MQSMYAKLFSRIAQSSLMEQDVATRYCFMMLLAISDPYGDVIGTDVAIARTVNLPLDTFKRCLADLMSPDPDSNSQAKEGRRVVESEAGRGYTIVNYLTYRAIKSEEEKKAYMREYMARRRKEQKGKDVTDVKICKTVLNDVTQSEGELERDREIDKEKEEVKKSALPPVISKKPVVRPSQEEVEAYAVELGLTKNDGAFKFDGWLSNGFTANGKPVKDWKAAMRTWQRGGFFPSQKAGSPQSRRAGEYPETIMGKIITI